MMQLYRKNETLFAVVWIVVYVIVAGNLRSMGDDSPAMTGGLAAITAGLVWFVRSNGLTKHYGLTSWARNPRQMLWFAPLWIIVSGNLWGGIEPHFALPGLAFAMVSMALVGFVEEMVFRGLLFRAMLRSGNETTAIVVSAVTFGIGHIVNLLTGHGTAETLVQMVFAVAMGFVFTLVYHKGGSLWPCIVAHSLIDVFSVMSAGSDALDWAFLAVALACAVGYSVYLWKLDVSSQ